VQVEGITWHAVTLKNNAFDETKKLVSDVLGLTPMFEQPGVSVFSMPNGTLLELYTPQAVPSYGYNDGAAFGFRVDDIEAASQELADAGYELLGEITRVEEMRYAYRHFKGPDGTVYAINEHI
jgi:hypothetical protein